MIKLIVAAALLMPSAGWGSTGIWSGTEREGQVIGGQALTISTQESFIRLRQAVRALDAQARKAVQDKIWGRSKKLPLPGSKPASDTGPAVRGLPLHNPFYQAIRSAA
jgi:hypothetical protein